jgi:hypothetical protein
MAANVEDFSKRLVKGNRQFTFVFTEDFFEIVGPNGVNTARFLDLRHSIQHVGHRKGLNAEITIEEGKILFDVDIAVIRKGGGFTCFMTTFDELNKGPFADDAMLYGLGGEHVDAQKAKFQVSSFLSEKAMQTLSTTQLITNCRSRKIVLVVEAPKDFKRPALEPFMKLRASLTKVLCSSEKSTVVVDCQVTSMFAPGNTSSLSSLLNYFCVYYS